MTSVHWGRMVAAAAVVLAMDTASAEPQRVAVLNLERVFRAHPKTERAIETLSKQAESFKVEQGALIKERDVLEQEIKKLLEAAENMMLTEKARDEKKSVAREKLGDLREMEQKLRENKSLRQRELTDQELRMREELVGEIRRTATDYAKANKIDVVLNSAPSAIPGNEPIICASDTIDITVPVMKAMGIEKEPDVEAAARMDAEAKPEAAARKPKPADAPADAAVKVDKE